MIYAVNKRTKEHRRWPEVGSAESMHMIMNNNWQRVDADAVGWIAFDGEKIPTNPNQFIQWKGCSGFVSIEIQADAVNWGKDGNDRIIAYRPISNQPASEEPKGWGGPEDGLPKPGHFCEVHYIGKWRECEIVANFKQRAGMVAAFTIEMDDGLKILDAFRVDRFRPIRTDREIWIEAAGKAIEGPLGRKTRLEIIYDALASGELPTPEKTK